jgi:hypothetical protein
MTPRLELADSELLVAGELRQGDAGRRHVLVRAYLSVAAGGAALVRRKTGAGLRREADPLCLAVACLAVVTGPAGRATVGAAVTRGWLTPADADVAFGACRILAAHLTGIAVLLIATLLGAVALRNTLAREVQDMRFHRTIVLRNALARVAEVSWGAIAVFQTLTGLRFWEDSAEELQVSERGHGRDTLEAGRFALAREDTLTGVYVAEHRRLEQLIAGAEPLSQLHHFVGCHVDHAHDARHLRALAFRLESVLPTRIDAAQALAVALQTLDQLMRRGKSALAILLTLAGGLLIALIHGAPLAGARDVHALFNTKLVATTGSNTAFTRRLVTEPFMTNADTRTRCFAGVDVIAAVAAAYGLEHAWAITTRGPGNTPMCSGTRQALVTHETIRERLAVHRLITRSAVTHLPLIAIGIF